MPEMGLAAQGVRQATQLAGRRPREYGEKKLSPVIPLDLNNKLLYSSHTRNKLPTLLVRLLS